MRPCKGTTSGTFLDHQATKGTPQAIGGRGPKTSRSPPGRRRAVTPQNTNGGQHPEWVPSVARTEATSDRSPRGGAQAVLTPQGCKAARRSSTRRQETLAAPAAAAARRLPRHGESSSTRIRTEAMEDPTTPTPNGHHLTTDPRCRSKRPRTERAHIPTIPTPAERERQAALRTGPRQAADGASSSSATSLPRSAAGLLPGGQHAGGGTRCRPKACASGGGTTPATPPPREQGAMTTVPDTGTGHPTNWARAPRGSPPQLQHGQTARARRTHRNNRSTTRAAQERTQK